MATTTKQMPKPDAAAKPKREKKAPLSESDARKAFKTNGGKLLKNLDRIAKRAERLMRSPRASEAQITALRENAERATARILRAVRGEAREATADLIPDE